MKPSSRSGKAHAGRGVTDRLKDVQSVLDVGQEHSTGAEAPTAMSGARRATGTEARPQMERLRAETPCPEPEWARRLLVFILIVCVCPAPS